MSSSLADDSPDTHSTSTSLRNIPVLPDGTTRIIHNKNDATIGATLHHVGAWMKRTRTYATLVSNRTSSSHGKIYLDSPAAYTFITEKIPEEKDYGVDNPCPRSICTANGTCSPPSVPEHELKP